MCGVAGIIALKNQSLRDDLKMIESMVQALTHRGPDDRDVFYSDRVHLGNTRLAVIDPHKRSVLPMRSSDDQVILCYNGEVSNFKELEERYRLREKYSYKGFSDSETLLYLYKELGINFLSELSGMFAFCIVDLKLQKAFVVRDFFGILPLFYTEHDGRLFFASEIKSILSNKQIKRQINRQAIYDLFTLAYIPGTQTAFENIHELDGGELLEIDLASGVYEKRHYFNLADFEEASLSQIDAVKQTEFLIKDSVRRNLIADCDVGSTLSGGIDTSSLVGFASTLSQRPVHTFSIKVADASFDESFYQKKMSDFSRSIHHEVKVDLESVKRVLKEHVKYVDEPYGHGAAIPSFLLAEEATKHVKVLLSGEGGDELFNAYPTYSAYLWARRYKAFVPKIIRALVAKLADLLPVSHKKLSFEFKLKRFTKGCELSTAHAHIYWRHVLRDEVKNDLFKNSTEFEGTHQKFEKFFNTIKGEDELRKLMLTDLKFFFIGDLMVKNDRMFLAHSVESRFPFVDKFLFDFIVRLPSRLKMRKMERRYLQKAAIQKVVPQEILARDGFGLEMPYSKWFANNDLSEFTDIYFKQERIEASGLFSFNQFQTLYKEHLNGAYDHGRFLWTMLIFQIWHEQYIESTE